MSYVIFTDTGCDLSADVLEKWKVEAISMSFHFESEELSYENWQMESEEFYNRLKEGAVAKTAAINPQRFKEAFSKALDQGLDAIYIGFSSALSNTYNAAVLAAQELSEEYPERKVYTVDGRCASAGQGLLLNLVAQKRDEGASAEQIVEFVTGIRDRICHWFTVDSLEYLKRGGRLNAGLAFVGTVLGLKPVLHMNEEGRLVNVEKARGRKKAFEILAKKYGELAEEHCGTVYISHAVCGEDAELLKGLLFEKFGAKVELITDIGPVIGSHSGPGTIALFFIGKTK